jgi:predicted Zn-dependent peptidase
MKASDVISAPILIAAILILPVPSDGVAQPLTSVETLPNGIRVAVVHFPGSTNASLFSFLPLSLTADGPGQTQWSHMVEHLVIRSTVPADAAWANAETLPDHMRLDFYGSVANWQEGLSHHLRWLVGETFSASILEAEEPKALQECDYAVRNLATHKFAMAAWNQGIRHGRDSAKVRGDVLTADLGALQQHRDRHLVVPNQTTVCLVGGVRPEDALPLLARQLDNLRSDALPSEAAKPRRGQIEMDWDLEARHVVLTWPIPNPAHVDHAALLVAAQWLNMRIFGDAGLKELAGMVFAGADLRTPEGSWFYISASVKPNADLQQLRARITTHLNTLRAQSTELALAGMIGRQIALNLTQVMDPKLVKANAPAGMTDAMIEANLGLQWATAVHRLGPAQADLDARLKSVTPENVRDAAVSHLLDEQASICVLRPMGGDSSGESPAQPK